MLNTAPAELQGFTPGFIRRAVVASSATMVAPSGDLLSPSSPSVAVSPKLRSVMAVQRPAGTVVSATPATYGATPSPTGSSVFSSYRYQLFGGPAPVQEATHSALAQATSVLGTSSIVSSSTAGAIGAPVRQLPSGPLTAYTSS